MNKYIEILSGLVFLVFGVSLGVLNVFGFGSAMLSFLKGGLGWLIIFIGLVLISLGITDLKD